MKNRFRENFSDRKRDREIHNNVRRRLDHESHGRLRRIRCEVQQGTVTLTGAVLNDTDRQQAANIVRRCPHVDGVINLIEVGPRSVEFAASPDAA